MKFKLIASFPGKRFDNDRRLCGDGRGGWSLSQANVVRWINDYGGCYLVFCFAVLAEGVLDNDRVQCTRVTARMGDDVIGIDEYKWKPNNNMWCVMDDQVIFEWPQHIEMSPCRDGLIEFSIDVKLASQPDWHTVEGKGFARIRNVGFDQEMEKRWIKPWKFTLMKLIPRRFKK